MSYGIRKFKKLLASSKSNDIDFRNVTTVGKRKSHCLNVFINSKLQTDEKFHYVVSNAIDCLYRHIQNHCGYSVNKMIKAGSLGKGTALKATSDLDCVLVLNDIENVQELIGKIDEIKTRLSHCLRRGSTDHYLSEWKITDEHETRFSLQFTMTKKSDPYKDNDVEVDLLPTFDRNQFGLDEIYREMRSSSSNTQQYYSAALTEFQRDFVKPLPSRIKDLIRLVKYWCKTFVKRDDNKVVPSSYLLELITIHAWEKVDKPTTINMAIAFKAVMEKLKNYRELNVAWHCNYNENQEMSSRELPRVLDPANPYNNLCAQVDCWDRVAEIAEETMDKPLFKDVEITSHWCRGQPPVPSRRRRRRIRQSFDPLIRNSFEHWTIY